MIAGDIYTIVGNGMQWCSGDGGTAMGRQAVHAHLAEARSVRLP